MDAVTQIVAVRAQRHDGLANGFLASLVAHAALVAAVILAPSSWFGSIPVKDDEPVMVISLGGAPGPRTGMTALGGKPVQEVIETKKAIEPVRPPAARAPEMIEPTKKAPPKRETKTQTDAKDPRSRTPTKGAEVREGSTVAETGGRGQGFGLSAGGGGVGGYLDVASFCCPDYLATMVRLIQANWQSRQQAPGVVGMKYVVQRDGRVTNIEIEKPSGYPALDLLAQRALMLTKLPALPDAFPEPILTVHLLFEYQR